MAEDKFANLDREFSPARKAFLITPHDSNELAVLPKAIRADSAGTIAFRAVDSDADITMTFAAGQREDVRALYVRASGTTVATIHGFA